MTSDTKSDNWPWFRRHSWVLVAIANSVLLGRTVQMSSCLSLADSLLLIFDMKWSQE